MKARRTRLTPSGSWRVDRDTAAIIAVARTLRQLLHAEPAFHVINGLLGERVDVDHLAVGTTGVFAIEAYSDDGVGRIDKRGHPLRGAAQEEALQRARRGCAAVRDRLRRRGFDVGVQGVLCLPFGNLERPQYVDGIIISRPEHLEYLIRHWPGQRLTAAQSARVFATLQARPHRVAA
jgi:hypothetical protein